MSYNEIVDKTPAAGGMTAWAAGMDPADKKRTTRYEIQVQRDGGWHSAAVVEAASARAAIREWHESAGEDETWTPMTLRAVPVRNITQVTVAVKTSTQLTFS